MTTYTRGALRASADAASNAKTRLDKARAEYEIQAYQLARTAERAQRAATRQLRSLDREIDLALRRTRALVATADTITAAKKMLPLIVGIYGDTPELQAKRREEIQ